MNSSYGSAARESGARLNRFDPTGEVDLGDPAAVEGTIGEILGDLYGSGYDARLLARGMEDVVAAYRGDYPGLLRCDTLYHDLRHALEAGLTAARILDGHVKSGARGDALPIDARHGTLCVLLALFHDMGLLRRDNEAHLWGATLMPIHEERGAEFMHGYLSATRLAPFADMSRAILATKLNYTMPADWSPLERRLGSIIATADLLSQCADRCYLEKCRDFLFAEFTAIGLAGTATSPYPDRETLLAKTPGFLTGLLPQRLDQELHGVHHLLAIHTRDGNPWQEAIKRNAGYLEAILPSGDFSRLRRQPQPFV